MSWAHYILQANIYLVIFFGFYKLFLANETYFSMNRIYLIMAGILSLTIPFLRIEWFTRQPVAQPIYSGVDQLQEFVQVSVSPDAPERFSTGNLLVLVYIAGIMIFTLLFLYKLATVSRLLKRKTTGNAFSFFSKKRIDPALPEIDTINRHEEIHIRQLHSLDVLFFELLSIFTWFNPIIYGYKSAVKNTHEYLADEEAAKFQGDKEQYALLLLSRAFSIAPHTLTNTFFNKSLLKKRIFMLHKQRSTRTAILKYGLFLPLFATTLMLSAATIRSNETIIAVTEEIPLNEPLAIVKEVIAAPVTAVLSTKKTTPAKVIDPKDPAWQKFYNYLKMNLRYPSEARANGIQGNVLVKFTLKDGDSELISVPNKLGSGIEGEILKALVTYKGFTTAQNGTYTLPIQFRLSGSKTLVKNPTLATVKGATRLAPVTITAYGSVGEKRPAIDMAKVGNDVNDTKIYDFVSVEQQPAFPGGMENFYNYLKSTVKYPKLAQENNIQGKVFLSFTVEKDGSLVDIKVERKLGGGTDEEAVRVLKESPKWVPGITDNKVVRVKFNIPISFTLSTPETDKKEKTGMTIGKGKGVSYSKITLRGLGLDPANEPLVYINGKKTELKMKDLNPDNIESIEILKSTAATKLYGPEAIRGVILVTNKKTTSFDFVPNKD
ncbi:TonB family protein [Pedobacter sp. PLR]|uniref:M56 family metallopeptidase protein n=1 Tax=Pedobacter sp. PLR TaxID=2994465 RepID=UPI0022475CF0|nr:M56 family metallopeptidase protein [Pedobacter sp. PLR]MCX2450460.1 TonB family protein [Pedobacter sp. PLR]